LLLAAGLCGDRETHRNVERTFNPSRKDPHWGRRKLKRDTV
jgi:hypothetical protein